MDQNTRQQYQTACRSAAVSILLSQADLETESSRIGLYYHIDPALVRQDIDLLMRNEQQKISGVFKFDGSQPKRNTTDD